jgi:hypothetical protein
MPPRPPDVAKPTLSGKLSSGLLTEAVHRHAESRGSNAQKRVYSNAQSSKHIG